MSDLVRKLQERGGTIHIVSTRQADSLVEDGYARRAVIDPKPGRGRVAVNLTVKGKSPQ